MRAIFLPVWSTGILNRVYKWIPGTSPDEGWFDRSPLCYQDSLLSYVDFGPTRPQLDKSTGEFIHPLPDVFPPSSYTFGDSGGFTLISKPDEKLDPVEVLQWQMKTVNVGAILDRPPRRTVREVVGADQPPRPGSAEDRAGVASIPNVIKEPFRDWQGCLDFTIRNVSRALPYYQEHLAQGGKFRWWGVLHGNSEQEAYSWYRALTAVYPFSAEGEGWAVYPGPQAEPKTVARAMRVLQKLGIKRAHFLACTGQDVIATILALGPQAGLELVTFDSMSHAVASINRWWFTTDPTLGGRRGRSNDKPSERKIHKGVDYVFENVRCLNDLPEQFCAKCPCDVCVYLRECTPARFTDGPDQAGQGGWRDAAITLHNIKIQSECIRKQEEAARKDPYAFLRAALDPLEAARAFRIFAGQESERPVATGSNLGLLRRKK